MTDLDQESTVLSRVLVDRGRYFEGPRWHGGRLWTSDTLAQTVFSVGETGDCRPCVKLDDIPCGLGFLPSGDLVILTMFGRRLLRHCEGGVELYADLSGVAAGTIDDMVIDGRGRAYVGDLGFNLLTGAVSAPVGRLILVMPDGTVRVVADGLRFPNGIAVSDDGSTLIVAESQGDCLAEFAIRPDGSLDLRRRFGSFGEPDGICLDREGCVWVASFKEDAFVRVAPTGEIVERILRPGCRAVACVLGGEDRKSLFLLTADTTGPELMQGRSQSRIEVVRVPVPGAGFP